MLGKLTDSEKNKNWCKIITDVEHAINNTINKSTAQSPSKLLFGVRQRGKTIDGIAEYLEAKVNVEMRHRKRENESERKYRAFPKIQQRLF